MAGTDVIVTTENVEILHIDFTATSSRPVVWRTKSILVLQHYILFSYDTLRRSSVVHQ